LLSRALVEVGHEVRVIGVYSPAYPAPDYEEDQGVRVWRLRETEGKFGWVPAWHRQYRQIKAWVQEGEIDLVEAPDSRGWYAGWPRLSVPLVLRSDGSNTYFAHELGKRVNLLTHWMERYSYWRTDAWIANSRHAGRLTRELFAIEEPDVVIPNVIDPPTEVPPFSARDEARVVFTGTLAAKKGVIPLIEAWPTVKEAVPAATLWLYGKDTEYPERGSMIEVLQNRLPEDIRESVHFAGHVSRDTLFDALKTARVGVFPSYTETFGNAAVESMACGCPTIYTRLTCGPEIVREGSDGLLAHPDRPEEVSDAMVRLLQDEAVARKFSQVGRKRVLDHFCVEAVLPDTMVFYEQLIRRT